VIFIRFFKTYPEIKAQYFGFLNSLCEEELRSSPRLQSHASGVLLGVTQIVNGLENPVNYQFLNIFQQIALYCTVGGGGGGK